MKGRADDRDEEATPLSSWLLRHFAWGEYERSFLTRYATRMTYLLSREARGISARLLCLAELIGTSDIVMGQIAPLFMALQYRYIRCDSCLCEMSPMIGQQAWCAGHALEGPPVLACWACLSDCDQCNASYAPCCADHEGLSDEGICRACMRRMQEEFEAKIMRWASPIGRQGRSS